tara:strand:- start:260 stop:1321 length:1062 start_codon:yes stop_codon:yes gene_type:complete
MQSLNNIRIGYSPCDNSFNSPGDKRRFIAYANSRDLEFEIANPSKKYDLVILTELSDISIWHKYQDGKIVYDLIDSYLAIPERDIKSTFRGLAGFIKGRYKELIINHKSAIVRMCRRSDLVICSTIEQQKMILNYCPKVHIILDIHNSVVKNSEFKNESNRAFQLVWEGLPSNITHLKYMSEILNELNKKNPVILNVITDQEYPRYFSFLGSKDIKRELKSISKYIVFHPFDYKTWSKIVSNSDLAVIPIDLLDPFAKGKPENKLLLFWRMGIPVITSGSPAYIRAQNKAHPNYKLTCNSKDEWLNTINQMIVNESLRKKIGLLGKMYAEENFDDESIFMKWDKAFYELGFKI